MDDLFHALKIIGSIDQNDKISTKCTYISIQLSHLQKISSGCYVKYDFIGVMGYPHYDAARVVADLFSTDFVSSFMH